jgi:hypothetical protein
LLLNKYFFNINIKMREPLEALSLPLHLSGYHRVNGQTADPWGTFKPSKNRFLTVQCRSQQKMTLKMHGRVTIYLVNISDL